jgi:hypothetical protein
MIPGIAKTKRPLKIFEPIRVPATASFLPFDAKASAAAISGRLVPIAKTVKPTNSSPNPRVSKIFKAPFVINQAPITKKAKDNSSLSNKYFSSDLSNCGSLPVLVLYQITMTTNKAARRVIEE